MVNVRQAPHTSTGVAPVGPAPWLAALLITTAVAWAYHGTLGVPFLFDDASSITDNPTIRSLWHDWWRTPGSGVTVSGRPFLNFTLALNYALSGTAVWSYHGLNLMIHAAAGTTLFTVLRRTLQQPSLRDNFSRDAGALALAAALLWTVHPLQTESVTYVIQRAESLVSLLYLLTLWAFIRSTEVRASSGWRWLAWVCCLLGMATKEVMVTAPIMVLGYDRMFVSDSWKMVWARHGGRHLALASTWLLLLGLVLATGTRGGTAGFGISVSPLDYALTQIYAVAHYLQLAFWPHPLVFDYGQFLVTDLHALWLPALVIFPLAAASLYGLWRGRPAGFAGFFFFAVLAPTSSFVPVLTQTMNEHRMYLALAAIVTVGVTGIYRWVGRAGGILYAGLVLVLGLATIRRNEVYRSAESIWSDTVARRPGNMRAILALGAVQVHAGQLDAGLVTLQEAVRLFPDQIESQNQLGNLWMKLGRMEDAAQCFRRARVLAPQDAVVMNNLANACLRLGRGDEALELLQEAVRQKPDFHEARYNLANTLAQAGQFAEAAGHYTQVLKVRPDDAEAHSNYGNVLLALNRRDEGVQELAEAARLQPANAEIRNNLGVALIQAGRPEEALRQFEEAVRLQPDFQGAAENLARARRQIDRR
jgi:tetratricopeptide (TPR) repeat protein